MLKLLSGKVSISFLIFLFMGVNTYSQKRNIDLLKDQEYSINTEKRSPAFSKILNKNIYYTTSFNQFKSKTFAYFSFPKNIFIVADRALRAGRLNFIYTPRERRNNFGLIIDEPYYYSFKSARWEYTPYFFYW